MDYEGFLELIKASAPGERAMREKKRMVHYDYCGPEAFRTEEELNEFIKMTR